MDESGRKAQLQAMAASLDNLIAFADHERDHVLAAKLSDASEWFVSRHIEPAE